VCLCVYVCVCLCLCVNIRARVYVHILHGQLGSELTWPVIIIFLRRNTNLANNVKMTRCISLLLTSVFQEIVKGSKNSLKKAFVAE